MVDGEPLHDHPAHRQPHHVGPLDTDGVEHRQHVAGHVGQRVVDAVELGRQADVAVVEAHDLVAARHEQLAPLHREVDALRPQAVDEEESGVAGSPNVS